jgi:hypothetical protein
MPEETKISRELTPEVEQLLAELSGHEAFRYCRGKLGDADWLTAGLLRQSERTSAKLLSPTTMLRTIDKRRSQTRIVLNMLAKLWRDGKIYAAAELEEALIDRNFVFTGEDVPVNRRKPGVLVIFEPEKVLDIMRWSVCLDPKVVDRHLDRSLKNQVDKKLDSWIIDRPELRPWTEAIMSKYPDIREGLEKYYDNASSDIYRQGFLPDFLVDFPQKWNPNERLRYEGATFLFMHEQQNYDTHHIAKWCVGCIFADKTQDEVLGLFERSMQEQIATWQFSYPAHVSFGHHCSSIGLFPEDQLDRFKKKWPAYVSRSKSQ